MTARLCIVDDDETILDSLGALFTSRRLKAAMFDDPRRFLSVWTSSELREVPATLILDIRMPELSGLELFAEMRQIGLPSYNTVIFLTGHGDVPLAVEAMKAGARDFLEKPFSDNSFVDRVVHAMRLAEKLFETSSISSEAEDGMSSLTSRERTIAEMIALGRTNRAIGDELSISTRTVEAHRAKIFEKLNVKNAVELVRRVQRWPRRPSGSGAAGDPTSEPSR